MTPVLEISHEVTERFPDYDGLVLVATGLTNGPSDARSQDLLREAEQHARAAFAGVTPSAHPHMAAWRSTFSAFGVKPKKMLNSAEALISRVVKGGELPAINRLVDAYNAVSVRYAIPCGGENLDAVVGTVQLKVADGSEVFDTVKDGVPAEDHPLPGEIVWADEAGVTCRAWNWRQGTRTRLTEDTTNAYFLFDALPPVTREQLEAAGDSLEALLHEFSPGCQVTRLYLEGGNRPTLK